MKEAIQYHIFKQVQDNPEITQRELAAKTGISLGKINYCLQALVNKGFIKATNFKNSKKKSAYLYKLTPQGLEEKAKLTVRFLKYKMDEYDRIKAEIEELKKEVQGSRAEGPNENSLGSEPNGHSRRQANVF